MKIIIALLSSILFFSFSINSFSQDFPNSIKGLKQKVLTESFSNGYRNQTGSDSSQIVTVLPGNGATSVNGRAPQGSRLFINSKYIISRAEMNASGFGSHIVTSVGWNWSNNLSQNISTTGSLKVYLKDTVGSASTLTFPQNFNTIGMTKVIDATITIPSMPMNTPFSVDVPIGGPGTSTFETVLGHSVIVAFEYQTTSTLAVPLGAPTINCTNSINNSIGTYQSQTSNGTVLSASAFRPETRFGNSFPYEVTAIYTMGKIPWEWGFISLDTLNAGVEDNFFWWRGRTLEDKVNALLRKENPRLRVDMILSVINTDGEEKPPRAMVNILDSTEKVVEVFLIREFRNVVFQGKSERVIVQAVKGAEPFNAAGGSTDTSTREYCRNETCDAYGYADICYPDDGGMGFSSTGGYIVAMFPNYSSSVFPIYAVDHYFFNALGSGSQPYKIVIFGDNGTEKPGSLLYTSPTLTSPPGNFSTQKVTHEIYPPVNIPGNSKFFVGYQQISTTNIGAGFQYEVPVRDSAFFYSFTGSPNSWVDFGPDSSNFRIDISPRTSRTLFMSAYLEGFYNGTSMIPDVVKVEIRNSYPPYTLIEQDTSMLNSNGSGVFSYIKMTEPDSNYFFVLKHRNHIETWSHATPENFNDCFTSYNFTDSASKAFGNNLLFSLGKYLIYGGDVNQDGIIDGSDGSLIDNDASNFVFGYVVTDVNGDDIVDGSDSVIADNNAANFITKITP